jgi:hypothetical protein
MLNKFGACKLCFTITALKYGHIIPSFYFKNEKRNGERYFRFTDNPNERKQDGTKYYIMCGNCEQLVGRFEKKFSEKIYIPVCNFPMRKKDFSRLLKNEDAVKFGISMLWKTLVIYLNSSEFKNSEKKINF